MSSRTKQIISFKFRWLIVFWRTPVDGKKNIENKVKIEEDKEKGEGSWSGTTKQNKIKLKKTDEEGDALEWEGGVGVGNFLKRHVSKRFLSFDAWSL